MSIGRIMMIAALCAVVGCGGYDESTPEGFYKAYVSAWADSDFDKVLSMHFTTDAKPVGIDFSRAHIESEIRAWADETGDKTPMSVCKKTLREMDSMFYSQDDEDIKVLYGQKGMGESFDPLLTIIKVDGRWKVQTAYGSRTSRQNWIRQ